MATILGTLPKGEKIGTKFAPKFISSTLPGGLESLTYVDGHRPRGPTEASLTEAVASEAGLSLGDTLKIVTEAPPKVRPKKKRTAGRTSRPSAPAPPERIAPGGAKSL